MLTEPKEIGHLNDEDAEGIQEASRGYSKRTLANGRLVVTRVPQEELISLMYWGKDQHRLRETTKIFNGIDAPTLHTMIKESKKRESCRK